MGVYLDKHQFFADYLNVLLVFMDECMMLIRWRFFSRIINFHWIIFFENFDFQTEREECLQKFCNQEIEACSLQRAVEATRKCNISDLKRLALRIILESRVRGTFLFYLVKRCLHQWSKICKLMWLRLTEEFLRLLKDLKNLKIFRSTVKIFY